MQVKHNYWQYAKTIHRLKHEAFAVSTAVKAGQYVDLRRVNIPDAISTNLNPLRPLVAKCRSQGYLRREFIPREVQAKLTEGTTPPLLWVSPGSNPFWLRRLIEYSSGFYTGSVYNDPDALTELPGERRCDMSVIAIHASTSLHDFEEIFSPFFPGDCDKCMGMFAKLNQTGLAAASKVVGFRAAIGVIREPLQSIYHAYVKQASSQHHFYASMIPKQHFNQDDFAREVLYMAKEWAYTVEQYLRFQAEFPENSFLLVRYEDLQSTKVRARTLRRMLDFLGIEEEGEEDPESANARVECAFGAVSERDPLLLDRIRRYLTQRPADGALVDDPEGRTDAYVTFDDLFRSTEHARTVCEIWTIVREQAAQFNYPPPPNMTCTPSQQ